MEIKVRKTANNKCYQTEVSLSAGTLDDQVTETMVLLQAIGDSIARKTKNNKARLYFIAMLAEYLTEEVEKYANHKKR